MILDCTSAGTARHLPARRACDRDATVRGSLATREALRRAQAEHDRLSRVRGKVGRRSDRRSPGRSAHPGVVAKMVAAMAADRLSARSRQAAVGTLKAATAWAARPTVRLVPVDPLRSEER